MGGLRGLALDLAVPLSKLPTPFEGPSSSHIEREHEMSDTMKALLLRQHGELENLELVTNHPKPKAKPGSVVIRVRASSFNYHDVFTVKGMPGIKVPLPVVIGLDMAGGGGENGGGGGGGQGGGRGG